jgi:hypothetical protein
MMRTSFVGVSLLLVVACGSAAEEGPATDDSTSTDELPACRGAGPLAVHFDTEDGVRLTADLHPAAGTGGPAVVLLHMNPEGNDNSNFPPEFIEQLTARTLTVLNVNRRGAGGSAGTPGDSFEGPSGRLDAKAAQAFLVDHCSTNASAMVWVGASNGTTTAWDFTVAASTDPALPLPRGLVFMSGGSYTENQHPVADNLALLQSLPVMLAYPDSEAEWNDTVAGATPPASWQVVQYDGGSHGSGLLTSNPESVQAIADFVGVTLDVGMGW